VAVLGPNKLILSRPIGGNTSPHLSYVIRPDDFGQLYDHLVTLVAGGPEAGAMPNRSVPPVVADAGTVSLKQEPDAAAEIVVGERTNWNERLDGLTFQAERESRGTIRVDHESPDMEGTGTSWDDSLVGMMLQIAGDWTGSHDVSGSWETIASRY
jgi:hypothetical protein